MTFDFDIEYDGVFWWAAHNGDDYGVAIGRGTSAWEAVGKSIEDVPNARRKHLLFEEHIEAAKAGRALCPGCGALRPKMTDADGCWFPYCDDCRGPLE